MIWAGYPGDLGSLSVMREVVRVSYSGDIKVGCV